MTCRGNESRIAEVKLHSALEGLAVIRNPKDPATRGHLEDSRGHFHEGEIVFFQRNGRNGYVFVSAAPGRQGWVSQNLLTLFAVVRGDKILRIEGNLGIEDILPVEAPEPEDAAVPATTSRVTCTLSPAFA